MDIEELKNLIREIIIEVRMKRVVRKKKWVRIPDCPQGQIAKSISGQTKCISDPVLRRKKSIKQKKVWKVRPTGKTAKLLRKRKKSLSFRGR